MDRHITDSKAICQPVLKAQLDARPTGDQEVAG